MALFLTISEGRSGEDAVPILATSEPQAIRAVIAALECRLYGRKSILRTVSPSAERRPK